MEIKATPKDSSPSLSLETVRYTTVDDSITITAEPEGIAVDVYVTFLEATEVILYNDSKVNSNDQEITYSISPENENITIGTSDGTITIASSATSQDSGKYILIIEGSDERTEKIEYSIFLDIKKPVSGKLDFSTESESIKITKNDEESLTDISVIVEQGTKAQLEATWLERKDDTQSIVFSIDPENEHVIIDVATGTITIDSLAGPEDSDIYTVRATGEDSYLGEFTTTIKLSIGKLIDGSLNYQSTNEDISVAISNEEDGGNSIVEIEEGTEVVLTPEWSESRDIDQTVAYSIGPNNTGVSIDPTTGIITIASTASPDASADYTVTANGIDQYKGTAAVTIRIRIIASIAVFTMTYTTIETVEGSAAKSSAPVWDKAIDAEVYYTLEDNVSPDLLEIDESTGVVSVTEKARLESLTNGGVYTVTARAKDKYVGKTSTNITVVLTDWCDLLNSGTVPTRENEDEAYTINTWKELLYLSIEAAQDGATPNLLDSYKLMNSILLPHKECSIRKNDASISFTPIGGGTKPFEGEFDGGGNSIEGLYINKPTEDYKGLFGTLKAVRSSNVIVKNLKIKDVEIYANAVAGSLAGLLEKGRVTNVTAINGSVITGGSALVRGIISLRLSYAGGLVGGLASTTAVTSSSSAVTVQAVASAAGGLVGCALGAVEGYAEGNVTGKGYIGGLVGLSAQKIMGYATGNVNGVDYIGGLVGLTSKDVVGYATGDIVAATNGGGLAGNASGTVIGYATGDVVVESIGGGLIGNASGTVKGYATGDVAGASNIGGLVGSGGSSANIEGYARGDVLANFGSTHTSFGLLMGTNFGSAVGYYSSKNDESTLYELDESGNRKSYEGRGKNDAGTGVNIVGSESTELLKTMFGDLEIWGDDARWIVEAGHWPAIKFDNFADLEGAQIDLHGQSEYTQP